MLDGMGELITALFSSAFYLSGHSREAENVLLYGLKLARERGRLDDESYSLSSLLLAHAARGSMNIAETLAGRAAQLTLAKLRDDTAEDQRLFFDSAVAQKLLWQGQGSQARLWPSFHPSVGKLGKHSMCLKQAR